MASCSNSEFQGTYDIFLSFRGLDTRKKFTDHLYETLKREGFQTFRDDDEMERGENIKSVLRKAIENSRMSIVVLSKNYPNSMACLCEIQTILEHRKKSDHVILPVFYEVDPLDIKERAKNLDFGKETVEEVKGWSAALEEVASMAGMVSGNQSNGYEAKFIEEIIGVLKIKQAGKHLRVGDYLDLDESMRNLKKKLEYLTGQENDIYSEICSAERQPWKRRKKEVEVWLTDVQRFKDDVQRLEQEVVGETNVFSRMLLGKDIVKMIQEVSELQKKGRDFNGLLIDELPAAGRLLIPPTKDFVESTKSRNVERVWACLMTDDVRQIGVYGMGGIGKTTIMKHIHNQLLEEKGKFDTVYWVTVSKAFNITKLQSDIATALYLSLREDEEVTRRASQLYAALSRQKRYVLILDDLWEPFALERVGIPEPMRSNGCKLVLTTRSLEVCRRMECTPVKVDLLTEEEALTLFLSKAVGNYDTVLAPEVEEIAAKIAKQCACLPLAIVTLAGSLRGLKGTREWRNALNELVSSTEDASDDESEVFEQLKFSYSRLGSKVLQDCFLYCSLYPEDHEIHVNELIEYWIAEELICDMDSEEAQFDKGHAILGKLTSSCLLESVTDTFKREFVRMHDLIRDMALRITRSSPRFVVNAGETKKRVPYEPWSDDLQRISFMDSLISELPITPPVCPRLTTLLLNINYRFTTLLLNINYRSMLEVIPNSFFSNMPCLEVLDLSRTRITLLPESISNLENLHALFLRCCKQLKNVPSLERLKALKMFVLTDSKIEELPEGIEELVNLRKLDLSGNEILRTFPSWKLRRLSKLQYLRIDKTGVEVSAEDLLCLKQLKVVSVHFHFVQQLIRYVTSRQFQGLEKYCLTVGERHISYDPEKDPGKLDPGKKVYISSESVAFESGVDQLVLPADINSFRLELPANINPLQHDGLIFHDLISLSAIPCFKDARDLRTCQVSGFVGLESIFSSSSFSEDGLFSLGTVEVLELEVLPTFRVLFDGIAPPHSIYFNLKVLYFSKCDAVKNIFPVQLLQNFPNLEEIGVRDCQNVEDIIVEKEEMSDRGNHQDYSNSISLPKLKFLDLNYLPKLKSIYNGVMVCPSLEGVVVRNCRMVRRLPLSLHMDSDQATAPPFFKYIRGDNTWWESLEWDDPLAKTILEPYLLDYLDYEDYEKDYPSYEKDYLNFEDYVDYADSVDNEDFDDDYYEDNEDLNKLLNNLIHLNN